MEASETGSLARGEWRLDYVVETTRTPNVSMGTPGADVIRCSGGQRAFDTAVSPGDLYGAYASDGAVDVFHCQNGVRDHIFKGEEDLSQVDPFDFVSISNAAGVLHYNEGGTGLGEAAVKDMFDGDWDAIRQFYEDHVAAGTWAEFLLEIEGGAEAISAQ
jgi:hypothetical protein